MGSRGQGTVGMSPGVNAAFRKRDGGGPSKRFGCSSMLFQSVLDAECGRLAIKEVENGVKPWGDTLKMQEAVSCSLPAASAKMLTLLCASL